MRIQSSDRMSNSGYHRCGHARWWLTIDGKDVYIPSVRGDEYLDIEIDDELLTNATEIRVGVGSRKAKRAKKHDPIEEVIVL